MPCRYFFEKPADRNQLTLETGVLFILDLFYDTVAVSNTRHSKLSHDGLIKLF